MKKRIANILSCMARDTYEREEVLALSLLSALAGESIFLLGLPGVGKSMVARRLKLAFRDARVFEYLMSRFSTPDEIFGPSASPGSKTTTHMKGSPRAICLKRKSYSSMKSGKRVRPYRTHSSPYSTSVSI